MSDEEHVELHRDSKGRYKGDDTPPQNGIILVATIVSVTTLFSLKFAFDSYLDQSTMHARRDHIATSQASEQLADYRATAQEQLRGGEMPIADAMQQLAERGRGAFPVIRPVGDTNPGPREGWAAMPAARPEPAPHAQRPAPVEVPAPTPVPVEAPTEAAVP